MFAVLYTEMLVCEYMVTCKVEPVNNVNHRTMSNFKFAQAVKKNPTRSQT